MSKLYISTVFSEESSGQASFDNLFRKGINQKILINFSKRKIVGILAYYFSLIRLRKYWIKSDLVIRLNLPIFLFLFVLKLFRKRYTLRCGPLLTNLRDYKRLNESAINVVKIVFSYLTSNMDINYVCVTPQIKVHLIEELNVDETRIKVIPNPLVKDVKCLREAPIVGSCREIAYVGTIYLEQGVSWFLRLLTREIGEFGALKNVRVHVIGSGSDWSNCINIVKNTCFEDQVHFYGSLQQIEIEGIIQKCHFCIAPFTALDYEKRGVSSLKVLEYLAMNRKVLTIDVPEHKYISKYNFGWLFDAGQDESCLKRLLEALMSSDYSGSYSSFIKREFNADKIIQEYYDRV